MKIIRTFMILLLMTLLTRCNDRGKRNSGREQSEYLSDKKEVPMNNCPELKRIGAKKLHGDDGSAWLFITKETCLGGSEYRIREFYESDCTLHWDGVFLLSGKKNIDLIEPYEFVPICTYESCLINQKGITYKLIFKRPYKECI